jgi:lipoprotein-anchoring transpeptidase ErfK/SrfK
MSATSLEHKTIRPGSLIGYSYYHSDRRPMNATVTARPIPKLHVPAKLWRWALAAVLVLAVLIVGPLLRTTSNLIKPSNSSNAAAPAIAGTQSTDRCAGNKSGQLVLVNIGQRHLWACQGGKTVYDSPVITGIQFYDSTLTPPGTYRISAKQTNLTLTGSDITGNWSDPVKYWMPFLSNPYGTYGFHDATWRPNSAFGKVNPASKDASHGCVELPLGAAKWLYNWANVGTTVTIES